MTAAINVLNSTKNLSILGRPKSVAQYTVYLIDIAKQPFVLF